MAKSTKSKVVLSKASKVEAESYKLSTQQEEFAQLCVEFRDPRAAYIASYKPSDDKSYGSITATAQALLEHPAIRKRINEIRKPAIDRARASLEDHLFELASIRDAAMSRGAWNAAAAAEIARGKVLGYYSPRPDDDDKLTGPSQVILIVEDASIKPTDVVVDV